MIKHVKSLGFTNRLALYILLFLALGLLGGFYLAIKSIANGYTGSLLCYTVVFTPIGTVAATAFGKISDKNKAENTEGGITYEAAKAAGFTQSTGSTESPAI